MVLDFHYKMIEIELAAAEQNPENMKSVRMAFEAASQQFGQTSSGKTCINLSK